MTASAVKQLVVMKMPRSARAPANAPRGKPPTGRAQQSCGPHPAAWRPRPRMSRSASCSAQGQARRVARLKGSAEPRRCRTRPALRRAIARRDGPASGPARRRRGLGKPRPSAMTPPFCRRAGDFNGLSVETCDRRDFRRLPQSIHDVIQRRPLSPAPRLEGRRALEGTIIVTLARLPIFRKIYASLPDS